jgi:hypothetical protein
LPDETGPATTSDGVASIREATASTASAVGSDTRGASARQVATTALRRGPTASAA